MAKLIKIELIHTFEHAGTGIDDNPYRLIERWFTVDGKLLIERDPFSAVYDASGMIKHLQEVSNDIHKKI